MTLAHVASCCIWYAALLAAVVEAADPADLAWHPWGTANRSGFAAMGADEILVHGSDIGAGFGLAYDPPQDLCGAILSADLPLGTRPRRPVDRAPVGQRARQPRISPRRPRLAVAQRPAGDVGWHPPAQAALNVGLGHVPFRPYPE